MKRRFGQATLELALVLPIFMLLVVGIFDFGRAFHIWSTLNLQCVEAARVGARRRHQLIGRNLFTATTHSSLEEVQAAFDAQRSPMMTESGYFDVNFEGVGQTGATTVKVSAKYKVSMITPFMNFYGEQNDEGKLVMYAEAVENKE